MPIGIQRLNAPPQPSSRIIFIKPLTGPTEKYARDFLERVASICDPIMRSNHLSIMTLEEHEPNPDFIGRNFNAGEIIQLVLKAPYSGHWLSFRSVQMVMMHELAHCKQMNHSGAFWKVNNQFKGELRDLWNKGYTGEGLWGRGQTLLSGEYDTGRNAGHEEMPRSLCGGTFRSSRRKRKRAGRGGQPRTETYAERQQRRIANKFGLCGTALGGNEDTRLQLEKGVKVKGKPRVANSSRGRELRVAAALARFGQQKEGTEGEARKMEDSGKDVEDASTESDDEEDYEEAEVKEAAFNLDGTRLRDAQGRDLVRVCEDVNQDDVNVKREIEELHDLEGITPELLRRDSSTGEPSPKGPSSDEYPRRNSSLKQQEKSSSPLPAEPPTQKTISADLDAATRTEMSKGSPNQSEPSVPGSGDEINWKDPATGLSKAKTEPPPDQDSFCSICTMSNEVSSLLCVVCSHVLDTKKATRYWQCQSDQCKDSSYINAADVGLCGVCGSRRGAANGGDPQG